MSIDLEARRKALEGAFFREQDEILLKRLRESIEQKEAVEALAELAGVRDEQTLRTLVQQGVRPESFVALMLVPLVSVAWADEELSTLERLEILHTAREYGIEPGSVCHDLLKRWLESPPDGELIDAWLEYARNLVAGLDEDSRSELEREILKNASDVAKASGGVLRIGRRVSSDEKNVIDQLRRAFRNA